MNISALFSIFLFIVGVALIVAYAQIVESAGNEIGINTTTARVIQGIYTIGVIFICFGLSYLVCNWKCACEMGGMGASIYIGFLCLLGIVLTTLGGILYDKTKNMGSSVTKKWAVGIISSGTITTVMAIGVLVYVHKESIKTNYAAAVSHIQGPAGVAPVAAPKYVVPPMGSQAIAEMKQEESEAQE